MLSKIAENLRIAVEALMTNRMRSVLTMLGITIGVASVILLMSIGQAVEKFIIEEFSSFGSNIVVVFGKASNEVFDQFTASEMDMFIPLTQEDVDAIRNPNNVPDAAVIAAAVGVTDRVLHNGKFYEPQIAGITPSYLDAYNYGLEYGEPMTWEHIDSAARVAWVGHTIVQDVFDNQNPIGKLIRIGDVNFQVVGVWQKFETALDPEADNLITIPITTAQRRLIREQTISGSYPVMSISIKARNADVVDAVVQQVRETIRTSHELEVNEKDDFVVFSQNSLLETLDTVTSLLTVFLGVIAGISLLVGGIGIMNIMLVTVTERTKEIGLRKAIGAQHIDILTQFLVEAVTLSVIGGAVGTIIAISGSLATSALIPDLEIEVKLSSVMLAVFISISIGTFFGAYPANRAAGLNPIDALRYE